MALPLRIVVSTASVVGTESGFLSLFGMPKNTLVWLIFCDRILRSEYWNSNMMNYANFGMPIWISL
jgi:hypothetical protein